MLTSMATTLHTLWIDIVPIIDFSVTMTVLPQHSVWTLFSIIAEYRNYKGDANPNCLQMLSRIQLILPTMAAYNCNYYGYFFLQ